MFTGIDNYELTQFYNKKVVTSYLNINAIKILVKQFNLTCMVEKKTT